MTEPTTEDDRCIETFKRDFDGWSPAVQKAMYLFEATLARRYADRAALLSRQVEEMRKFIKSVADYPVSSCSSCGLPIVSDYIVDDAKEVLFNLAASSRPRALRISDDDIVELRALRRALTTPSEKEAG